MAMETLYEAHDRKRGAGRRLCRVLSETVVAITVKIRAGIVPDLYLDFPKPDASAEEGCEAIGHAA